MYLYGNTAVLQQARIWLFSCFLSFFGDLHKSLLTFSFHFFLQATFSLPLFVAQRWCRVVSHHMPVRLKHPTSSLGLIDPSRKSIQLFAQDGPFACEWRGLISVKAAIDENVHRRGRCPLACYYWVPICVKLLLLKPLHISIWIVSIVQCSV